MLAIFQKHTADADKLLRKTQYGKDTLSTLKRNFSNNSVQNKLLNQALLFGRKPSEVEQVNDLIRRVNKIAQAKHYAAIVEHPLLVSCSLFVSLCVAK